MLTGHCLCGAIRYEVDATPLPLVYCHCEECRRASGSSMNTTTVVRTEELRIAAGEESLRFYESSPGSRRHFCSRCGTAGAEHVAVCLPWFLPETVDRDAD